MATLKEEVYDILERVSDVVGEQTHLFTTFPEKSAPLPGSSVQDQYLRDWFAPKALEELLTYRHYIEEGDYLYKDILKVILSRSARSARLTTHFDLDFPKKPQKEPYWCYKHRRQCTPVDRALHFLRRYSIDTVKRVAQFAELRRHADVSIYHADSRTTDMPLVDGAITSPPYVGLIDYHEQHAYAYHLLGLTDLRESEIGAAAKGKSANAREQYVSGMVEVFKNVCDAVRPGGRIIVVAHDKSGLYGKIAEKAGVRVEGEVIRHVNRRTGRRSSEFFESVFIWTKD